MDSDEKIAAMFILIEKQQKAVNQSIKDLNDGIKNIQKLSESKIDHQVNESIGELKKEAQNTLNDFIKPFKNEIEELNSQANKVSQNMATVANRMSINVAMVVGFVCLACVAAVAICSYFVGKDVFRLRAEQVQLQANIKALEEAGGKVYLNRCGGRLCVRVESSKNAPYTDKDTGLPMYFVK